MRDEGRKMGKRRWRKQKSTDRRQQARFAIELTIYALLFPLLFMVISLIYPIAKQLIGVATEDLEPLNAMLAYCLEYWWALIVALALTGFISVLFSHRIFGPMRSFEQALLHKKLNHYTEEGKDHQVFGFGHETLQLCEPFLGEKSTHSEPHILGRQLSAYVGGEDLTTQEGGTEFMKRSIEVHDAELELDQALEGEATNAIQKRVQSWPALSQHPEECFDREGVIGWREEKEKQDQEEKIRVISEIHLVGKENVSLKEDQHATRKPHPDPNTQEEDQREL